MDYFDGRTEDLSKSGHEPIDKRQIRGVFPTSATRFRMAAVNLWNVLALSIPVFSPLWIMAIFTAYISDGDSICFMSGMTLITIFFLTFIVIMILTTVIPASKKVLEINKTIVTDKLVEVRYWNGNKRIHQQTTRIPIEFIKDIHPITREEWRDDLKMGNIFRIIGRWPALGHSARFNQGASRGEIVTIEFHYNLDLHYYRMGGRKVHPLSSKYSEAVRKGEDLFIDEELYADDRIYVSMSNEDFHRFKALVEKRMRIQ